MSLPDRIRLRAVETPDAIAVETAASSLTYAALVGRIDAFGRHLSDRLPAGNPRIAVCLDRSVDLPAWLLAILSIGGAYVPIDASLPPSRIRQVLEGADPAIIVAGRSQAGALPATGIAVVIAEEVDPDRVWSGPRVAVGPRDLAYIIYTSGSTGEPKGVEIEQGSVVALLDAIGARPGFARGEVLLASTRISFDLSVVDMFLPLVVGGRLALLDLDAAADPRRLAAAIDRHRPDLMQATPSTWRMLLESKWGGSPRVRILSGGEAMTRELADRLLPRCAELWNMYGPTETTVWSTAHRVGTGGGSVPIGLPIQGERVSIVDAALAPVEPGVTGEIVIAGAGLARGYRGRPDLTAGRFVTLADGVRGYRTGDLGRIDQAGLIHCLGRTDDQVKVRGFRIELGDVESALAAHPAVAWCAARAWPDGDGETTLAGYVVPREGASCSGGDVKAFLATLLPPYMVPATIVTMAGMPLTPNGKVDRGALPRPPEDRIAVAAIDEGATVEQRLAAIWCKLLGREAVAPHDDFFELGGYSLITVRLLCHIEETFDRDLELSDLIGASTLSAMAALIAGGGNGANPVFILNRAGPRTPLYWLDAGPLMRGMALGMAPDQPVFALNLTRAEEARIVADRVTITAVAATLLERLLLVQPTGPYLIGGWCRWGIVAHELACLLSRRGHEVALLVMLDAVAPGTSETGGVRDFLSTVRHRIMARRLRATAPPAPASFSQRVDEATRHHRPAQFHGNALLLQAAEARPAADAGWRRHVAGLLMAERTPGNHESMVRRPHVATLAQIVDQHLIEAQRRATMTVRHFDVANEAGYATAALPLAADLPLRTLQLSSSG